VTIRLKDLKGWKGIDLQGRQKKGRFPVVAKSRRTLGGIVFDSRGEMLRYADLQLLERAGKISELRRQRDFPVYIGEKLLCTFTADFSYRELPSGAEVIEDAKSSGTQKDTAYRLRKTAAELYYGFHVREFGVINPERLLSGEG